MKLLSHQLALPEEYSSFASVFACHFADDRLKEEDGAVQIDLHCEQRIKVAPTVDAASNDFAIVAVFGVVEPVQHHGDEQV